MSKPNIIKVVILGTSGVGKSSILYRYVTNGWDDNIQTTLGAAFMDKQVEYKGRTFKFQIWDTAGQEKYAPLAQMYYRDAQVAVLVFDVTSKDSILGLKEWHQELIEKGPKNILTAVVGNKADLVSEVEVTYDEGLSYAKDYDAIYGRTSAKENTGITEVFDEICEKLINSQDIKPDGPSRPTGGSTLKGNKQQKKGCQC